MSPKRLWVGLDVGADEMTCCIVDDAGGVVLEHCLNARAEDLQSILKPFRRQVKAIAIEAGATGIHLSRSLLDRGYPVSIFDTRQVSKFLAIHQNKTDRNDARGLADIARIGRQTVSQVRLKNPETQRLRSKLVLRQNLVRMRVAAEGTIRSLFRLNGGRLRRARSANTLRRNVTEELIRLRKAEKLDLHDEVEPILELCESVRRHLERLDRNLVSEAEQNPFCQRFMAIPGVGPICALSFFTAIDEPFRFRRNAEVGAYLGMTPRVRQSGQTSLRLRITKAGNRMTRTHLVTAATSHLRYARSDLSEWGLALRERVGRGRARVAVARKLAVTMLAMWKSGREYEPYRLIKP